jgi:hypothetical protein
MSGSSLNESRGESCQEEEGVHLVEHAVHVSSHNDFGGLVLPHDVLRKLNYLISSLHHELLVARFEVHVEDVDFLAS